MQTPTTYQRDNEGYLVHPEEWGAEIAAELAAEEHIELTEQHWSILEFVREYWDEHKIIPDIRHVANYLAQQQGIDKRVAKQKLFKLFPYGYVKQTCKIAGMQRPRAWSTG